MSESVKNVNGSPVGRRIHIVGNTGAGKSTLSERLARILGASSVELDALNWTPNWVGLHATDPERLAGLIRAATAGEAWVVAGSYMSFSQRVFWPRLETVIWLDLPVSLLVWRILSRSWKRSRSRELLWGTNYERFWPQLMVWRKSDSLVWWAVTQQRRQRRNMLGCMADLRWSHVKFIRLTSQTEVDLFARTLEGRLVHHDV